MSMLNDSIEYDNALLTWKLPPKKSIELKNVNSVDILVSSTQQSNVDPQQNILHPQQSIMQKQFTHYATLPHHISNQSAMIISHIPNHLNGDIHIQQLNPHENTHIQQVMPISTQNVLHVQNDQLVKNVIPKGKNTALKKKVKRFPLDGIAYHSRQLGLKVPPKKSLGIKGKVIHRQTREVIHNVYKFMRDEARNGSKIPLANYRERVLSATGISKCTYSKITSKEFINNVLVEAFGPTKKNRKDIKISEGAMDQVVNENNSIYRPKINRDASTRDDVYNLEDLVPSDILNTLQTEAINVINSGDINHFGGFVASNIGTILRSDISQEMMIRKITIFLYIEYLIRFISTPMKSVTKKFCVCDKSVEVNNHILDTFSVNGPSGRNRPVHMKDKSLCYILILAAKAMDYEVDLTNLTKDCKIGVKKALEISRILAFNSSSKNKNVVTLKLPLPAPVAFKTKRRK